MGIAPLVTAARRKPAHWKFAVAPNGRAAAPVLDGGDGGVIGLTVELFLNSAWVDISPYVRYQNKVRIVRGKPNETSRIQPQTCTFVLNNQDGRFSPRNPLGPYYGAIGRNTPVRVSRMQNGIRRYRFYGEVPSWPVTSDISGNNVTITVTAAGILRRLVQGTLPLRSPLFRAYTLGYSNTFLFQTSLLLPVAYWPCEDGTNATSIASGLPSGTAMVVSGQANAAFAKDSTSFVASAPLPQLVGSIWTGTIPTYTGGTANVLRFLISVPATGAYDGAVVARMLTAGTAARLDVQYSVLNNGSFILYAYDAFGNLLNSTTGITNFNGLPVQLSVEVTASGGTVTCFLGYSPGAGLGFSFSGTVGNATAVVINPDGHVNDTTVGHVVYQSAWEPQQNVLNPLRAYSGESPVVRFIRLCGEQNVPCTSIFTTVAPGDSTSMGNQTIDTFPNLIQQTVDTGLGLMFEQRDQVALTYRTKGTLYNQAAKLTLDVSQHQLSGPLIPVDDDALTRNDVTVSRIGGSSAQLIQASGTLSTQPFPAGVGDYPTNYSISLYSDSLLADQAGWRLRLGTVDQPRFPNIPINLRHAAFTSNLDLMNAALTIDIGDRLVITNPPPWMPPDPISQIVQGYTETLGIFEHDMVLNCSPEDPYRIGLLDDTVLGHLDTDGSKLALPAGTADTTLSVSTTNPASPVWTTNVADFPFDIAVGGERMTVTNITGTGITSVALGVDGTFESGVAGWTVGTGSTLAASGAAAHSGSFSGLVAGPGTTLIQITTPYIAVTPLFVYTASVWLLLQAGTIDQAAVRIMWFDSTHSFISQIDSPIVTASGGWANLAVTQAAPGGAVFAQTQFHAHTPGTDSAFIDDFTLTTPSPQQFTVTRSVNGIVKAQTAGTDIRLWQPLYLSV